MPKQLILGAVFEVLLIAATCLMLLQPRALFQPSSEQVRSTVRIGGFVFLCITFCWSVVLGSMLALSSFVYRE
jgi:hypothetical protein